MKESQLFLLAPLAVVGKTKLDSTVGRFKTFSHPAQNLWNFSVTVQEMDSYFFVDKWKNPVRKQEKWQ